MPDSVASAPYDRHAAVYDRVVGSRLYNRVAWATDTADYAAFAREAVAAGDGPYLDVGCGTAVFTAGAYRGARRPLTLVDLSGGMLERARQRLDGASAEFVQADMLDLPFPPGRFETVSCFAMLHVLDDPWTALGGLRPQVASGGRIFASMLVDRGSRVNAVFMKALRRRGELGPARSPDEFAAAGRDAFGETVAVETKGSMAYLRAGPL